MWSLLSKAGTKLGQFLVPSLSDTFDDSVTQTWQSICDCSVINSDQSRSRLHSACTELLSLMKCACETDLHGRLVAILQSHKIPSMMVSFASANVPAGFVNETIAFFGTCLSPPLNFLVREPFFHEPLNTLIEMKQTAAAGPYYELINAAYEFLLNNPGSEHIRPFMVGDRSPAISEIGVLVPKRCSSIGTFALQLIALSAELPGLPLVSGPLISACVNFLKSCVQEHAIDRAKQKFLLDLNFCMDSGQTDFAATFPGMFTEEVVRPLVVEAAPGEALRSSIYILSFLSSTRLVEPIIRYLEGSIVQCLDSDEFGFLAVRCLSLVLEHANPVIARISEVPKRSPDVMSLLPAEWFVRSDLTSQLENARALVSTSLSAERTIKSKLVFDLGPILPKVQVLLGRFFENGLRMSLALTEFFVTLVSIADHVLRDESESGLYQTLQNVCLVAKRRVGMRDGTIENITKAYQDVSQPGPAHNSLFVAIVVLLEFLMELNAVAVSKQILVHRDASVTD
jgi:hypothetical protein